MTHKTLPELAFQTAGASPPCPALPLAYQAAASLASTTAAGSPLLTICLKYRFLCFPVCFLLILQVWAQMSLHRGFCFTLNKYSLPSPHICSSLSQPTVYFFPSNYYNNPKGVYFISCLSFPDVSLSSLLPMSHLNTAPWGQKPGFVTCIPNWNSPW